jgi:3-methyladenine DNA glycosylase AlkD
MDNDYNKIMKKLETFKDRWAIKGMARYGINPKNNYGISVNRLRKMAKEMKIDHELALKLWDSGFRDARILACLIDDPKLVTEKQMDKWANDFNSWDVCDLCCGHLFDKTEFAYKKAFEWSGSEKEFVKRGGFSLMAWLAVHDKDKDDEEFINFLPVIEGAATDERKYVKKAVNWALRQIGKRSVYLNDKALASAGRILQIDLKSAQWIANDAIRELTSEAVKGKLGVLYNS